jgi:RNA polymerase-binding transcription factor DksA
MIDKPTIRGQLTERLVALKAQVGHLETELQQPLDDNFEEQALEREDDQALDAIEIAALGELEQVRKALLRLDAGTYGICQACGGEIGAHRLAALPTATLCIDCAAAKKG